jgi:Cof subfamily protein (haloacid dehalogenase superfamily)
MPRAMQSDPVMSRISLVISDVDGTLVTNDKVLTERSQDAVERLNARGIAFTIISSRPAFGLRMLSDQLRLRLPMGAYNGGALVAPDLTTINQSLVEPRTADRALAVFRAFAIDTWIFTANDWFIHNRHGAYVDHEARTIQTQPTIVTRLEDHIDGVAKLVGVSGDFDRLSDCETALRKAIGDGASVARSQQYYLDVTPAGTNKGIIVTELMQRLRIPADEIVSIGDMENDVPMFQKSGFSIAMGNASAAVSRFADAVTLSNEEDGFAHAVTQLILPRADNTTQGAVRTNRFEADGEGL